MDHTKTTAINTLTHPAYLYIGDEQLLVEQTITLLQKQFCKQYPSIQSLSQSLGANGQACSICLNCRKIREQQHASIIWFCPEKQYAIDDLKVIFSTISFALEHDQHFFFVLQKADLLTTACANALLKSLEEPPAGYHFILLAQRAQLLLPTIKSRCLIEHIQNDTEAAPMASLLPYFTTTTFHDPVAFTKELESANPSEWESLTLLDRLIVYWGQVYKKSLINKDQTTIKQSERMIGHLKKAMAQPPMPGSSKMFWKNLFLQIKEL